MSDHWPEEPKTIFECSCGVEGLVVDGVNWDNWKEIWIAFWRFGTEGKCTCWKCRFRHIWQIIRHGHPWTDMVSLSSKDARRLANAILNATEILDKTGGRNC